MSTAIKLDSEYENLFASLLQDVEARMGHRDLTVSWPQVGPDYEPGKGTLYVGQAVDHKWGEKWPAVWCDNGRAPRVEDVREYSEERNPDEEHCLEWMEGQGKRPFVQAVRALASAGNPALAETGWSKSIAWSNLYKVAPRDRGLDPALRAAQFEACRNLLAAELRILRPARVVVLSGSGWFEGFMPLDKQQFEALESDGAAVVRVSDNPPVIVGPHPRSQDARRLGLMALVEQIDALSH